MDTSNQEMKEFIKVVFFVIYVKLYRHEYFSLQANTFTDRLAEMVLIALGALAVKFICESIYFFVVNLVDTLLKQS